MSEATVFRLYAEEAMRDSFKAKREDERQALQVLACTWATAALASDRLFGPSPTAWPRAMAEPEHRLVLDPNSDAGGLSGWRVVGQPE